MISEPPIFRAEPEVRIHVPPAESPLRTPLELYGKLRVEADLDQGGGEPIPSRGAVIELQCAAAPTSALCGNHRRATAEKGVEHGI